MDNEKTQKDAEVVESNDNLFSKFKNFFAPKLDALEEKMAKIEEGSILKEEVTKEVETETTVSEVTDMKQSMIDAQLEIDKLRESKKTQLELEVKYNQMIEKIPVESKNLLDMLVRGIDDVALKIEKVDAFKKELGSTKSKDTLDNLKDVGVNMDVRDSLKEFVVEELGKSESWIKKVATENFKKSTRKVLVTEGLSGDIDTLNKYLKRYEE